MLLMKFFSFEILLCLIHNIDSNVILPVLHLIMALFKIYYIQKYLPYYSIIISKLKSNLVLLHFFVSIMILLNMTVNLDIYSNTFFLCILMYPIVIKISEDMRIKTIENILFVDYHKLKGFSEKDIFYR